MASPRAIFFDLDETLIENRVSVPDLFASMYDEFAEQLGAESREGFFGHLRPQLGNLWNEMFLSNVSPEQQLAQAFTNSIAALELHTAKQANELGSEMFERYCLRSSNNVQLHDGARETLATLRERGLIVGIITNGIEKLQLGKINALGLAADADHITVSAQARAHKPHAAVFDLALNRAGVNASEAWQVGDHATNDVAGAIRRGMHGVFYDPSGERRLTAFDELEVQPSYVISALSEVVDLLQ